MSGFGSHELPDWVLEQFDAQTTLPHGPLELLPVPVEGNIVAAQSCVPSAGGPARWTVKIRSAAPWTETMRFYEEFMPLANYELIGIGTYVQRRSWFSHAQPMGNGVIVFRTAHFLGKLDALAAFKEATEIEVELAHCRHPSVETLADREQLRRRSDIRWTLYP